MNEMDAIHEVLSGGHIKKHRAHELHERLRELRAQGMEPTIDPWCKNCRTPVRHHGQLCDRCLRVFHPDLRPSGSNNA